MAACTSRLPSLPPQFSRIGIGVCAQVYADHLAARQKYFEQVGAETAAAAAASTANTSTPPADTTAVQVKSEESVKAEGGS